MVAGRRTQSLVVQLSTCLLQVKISFFSSLPCLRHLIIHKQIDITNGHPRRAARDDCHLPVAWCSHLRCKRRPSSTPLCLPFFFTDRFFKDAVVNHMSGGGNDILNHRNNQGACVTWGGKESSAGSPYFSHPFTYEKSPYTNEPPAMEYPLSEKRSHLSVALDRSFVSCSLVLFPMDQWTFTVSDHWSVSHFLLCPSNVSSLG